jgi:hypothetical protein
MKCSSRPQNCPAAALQVLKQLASPGPCTAHHLVRPWCSGVPREVSISFSIHMQMQPRNGISSVALLHHFFFAIGCAARNQLPHDVERNGSRTLSRGARVAVVPLRGPERWGFELLMWDRQIVVGIGQSEPRTPTDPGRSLHEGSKFVGIFSICVGERPRHVASHPRRKEGPPARGWTRSHDRSPPGRTIYFSCSEDVAQIIASSLAHNSLLRW